MAIFYSLGSYSNPIPSQKADDTRFGPGPYVPDIPPAAPPAPGAPNVPYQGAYDTNHVIGLDTSMPATVEDNQPGPNMFGGSSAKKAANSPGLDPYRRKRSALNATETEGTTVTTTVTTTTGESATIGSFESTTTGHGARVKTAGRVAKLVHDDGQINLDGKFKVIAPHDIQSDNINAGPQEVSLAATNSICMPLASFTVGITLLVAVLILSVLVTFFVCFRLRRYAQKLNGVNPSNAPLGTRREVARKTRVAQEFVQSTTCWAPSLTPVASC